MTLPAALYDGQYQTLEDVGSSVIAARHISANNRTVTLLTSAVRNATNQSADQTNLGAKGVLVILNVTAASGTGGLTTRILTRDSISGSPIILAAPAAGVIINGTYGYLLYPALAGVPAGSGLMSAFNCALPTPWYAQILHGDASNYTYSLSACLIG